MKHQIFLNSDDIVEMHYIGPISEEENMELIKQSYDLITKLGDEGKSPLVLVDLTKTDHFAPPAVNIQAMRDSEAFKMAGYGIKNQDDVDTAEELVAKAGAADHVRLFPNREKAVAWLKE